MEYFVYMTNECNLNCEYCSVLLDNEKKIFPLKPSYSTAELIEFLDRTQKKNRDSEIIIYFFGGEPSLEYQASIDLMKELQRKLKIYSLKFILHTNGLLLHRIPNELLKGLHAIICSVNYEKIPHYQLADSYFSQITDNIILTKKIKNILIIGRFTITEKTSLYTEVLQFAHFFDYVYWQIENTSNFENFTKFYKTYTYELKLTFTYWIKYIEIGILLKYIPFMAALRFMLIDSNDKKTFSCGYGSSMVYIQTDGTCFACSDSTDKIDHYIGDISKEINFTEQNILNYSCGNCEYRKLCKGRCGRMHKDFSKDQIDRYCSLNRYMFDLFIDNTNFLESIIMSNDEIINELMSENLELTEFTP